MAGGVHHFEDGAFAGIAQGVQGLGRGGGREQCGRRGAGPDRVEQFLPHPAGEFVREVLVPAQWEQALGPVAREERVGQGLAACDDPFPYRRVVLDEVLDVAEPPSLAAVVLEAGEEVDGDVVAELLLHPPLHQGHFGAVGAEFIVQPDAGDVPPGERREQGRRRDAVGPFKGVHLSHVADELFQLGGHGAAVGDDHIEPEEVERARQVESADVVGHADVQVVAHDRMPFRIQVLHRVGQGEDGGAEAAQPSRQLLVHGERFRGHQPGHLAAVDAAEADSLVQQGLSGGQRVAQLLVAVVCGAVEHAIEVAQGVLGRSASHTLVLAFRCDSGAEQRCG